MFLEAGLECAAVDLPEDTDPNRLLQERGPDGLLQVLKKRREIAGEAPVEPNTTTFQDGDVSFTATFGTTKYQLWPQAPFITRLRARLRVSRDHRMVMDVVDFYVGRSRKGILNQLIAQLELSRVDGERHLLTLMEHLVQWVASRREQEQEEASEAPTAPELSAAQKEEALHYLKHPRLVQRILNDMEELGYIGEENSKLLGYLISVSRQPRQNGRREADPILGVNLNSGITRRERLAAGPKGRGYERVSGRWRMLWRRPGCAHGQEMGYFVERSSGWPRGRSGIASVPAPGPATVAPNALRCQRRVRRPRATCPTVPTFPPTPRARPERR